MLLIGTTFILACKFSTLDETSKSSQNNKQNNNTSKNNSNNSIDPQAELQKQLAERSQQYLLSIEKKYSNSPELKARLKLRAERLVASGLKKLSNPSATQHDLLQSTSGQIDAVFFANALNKININNLPQNKNKKILLASQTISNNTLRALEFLHNHALNKMKIYVPTVREILLRVAVSDNIIFVKFIRKSLKRNSNLFDGLFAFNLFSCDGIVATSTRLQNLKSVAGLLAKNIKSIATPETQLTNFSHKNSLNNNIIANSVLITETIVLRN
jgi:hypothetical protein